ncbi:MAG: hypothetical protein WDA75_00335 [Candidatus Latescibacterota bacterium]
MNCQPIGQPCRNFQILGIAKLNDPRDGDREKVVLSNFASGAIGSIVLVDPATGTGEALDLPGDNGAWAVLNWRDERLLIGTCGQYGYLHSLDLATRQWDAPLRDEREQYIWNLCLGSDGLVYGGTWPGCVLLRYDPERRTLENLGRVSDHPDNMYSRLVYGGIPGHILISCGSAESHLSLWSMESRTWRRFGRPGASVKEINKDFLCLQTGSELDFYDLHTLEHLEGDLSGRLTPAGRPARYSGMSFSIGLADGRALATRGQEYYLDDGSEVAPLLQPIPAPRPATHILTIIADAAGRIWGPAGFGQTIFCHDPAAAEPWNSQVVCNNGGEVYGLAEIDGRLFLACYSGGDHVVYDPTQPWDQINNLNPRTLQPVGPELIRPAGRSVVGPDGHFWTGWMARYGTYGGGLSRIDSRTLEMTSWYDPMPAQAIVGLAADRQYLYFITSGGANGLPAKEEPLHFGVWSPEGRLVWKHQFPVGVALKGVAAVNGKVALSVDQRIEIFDPAQLRFERAVELETPCHYLAALPSGQAALFCGSQLWLLDPLSGTRVFAGELPGQVNTMAVTPAGEVYVAGGTTLYRLTL